MRSEGTQPDEVAGAVALLRRAASTIRAAAGPQDALAEAACEMADASSFIAEAMNARSGAGDEARRQLLAEALSCTRAANGVLRFALVRADDQARSGAGRSGPRPAGTHAGADIQGHR